MDARQEEINKIANIICDSVYADRGASLFIGSLLVDQGIRSKEGFGIQQHGMKFYEEDTYYTVIPIDYKQEEGNDNVVSS